MTDLGPAPEALDEKQLIALLDRPLDELIQSALSDESSESERIVQINRAKRNWKFVRGEQFLAPGYVQDGAGNEISDYVNVDTPDGASGMKLAYPINIVGGDCWKFVAVMGQSAPNVKAVPDDLEDDDSIRKAKLADVNIPDLRVKWDLDSKQHDIAFHQWTTGPVFGFTPYISDAEKYGTTSEPVIEMQDQEQPDGSLRQIPVETGVKDYPNGDVELDLCNVLQVTIPFATKKLGDCGYLKYEYMESRFKLLSLYREQLAENRDLDRYDGNRTGATTAAAEAQDATRVPSGVGRPSKTNEWQYTRIWLRPYMYEAVPATELRKTLYTHFPKGLKITRVGDQIVKLEHERLDDVWAVCKTGRGEYILDNPLCHDAIPIQKVVNDFFNLAIETILRSIPKTIVDSQLLDRAAMQKNEAIVAEVISTKTPLGSDINKMMASLPRAQVSDQLAPFGTMVRQWGQDISGIRPELSGGGAPTQTFREAKQRKDQALLQLGPCLDEQQRFLERVNTNGIRQRARYGSGQIKSQKQTGFGIQTDVAEMAELSETGWHCEADEGMPESFTERVDRLQSLLKDYPPEVQAALALTDSVNVPQILEMLKLPGFQSPMENERNKAIEIIRLLLQDQPIQDTGPDGQPTTIPSIPPDQFEDDHLFMANFTKKWCNSPAGLKEKEQNRPGYDNVVAWGRAHEQMAGPQGTPPPQIKSSLSVAAKMETLTPDIQREILEKAGIDAQNPASVPAMPEPHGAKASAPEGQESPLPPAPPGPPSLQQSIQ